MPDSSSQSLTGKQKDTWPKVKLSAQTMVGLNLLISANSCANAALDATVCVAYATMITPYG